MSLFFFGLQECILGLGSKDLWRAGTIVTITGELLGRMARVFLSRTGMTLAVAAGAVSVTAAVLVMTCGTRSLFYQTAYGKEVKGK